MKRKHDWFASLVFLVFVTQPLSAWAQNYEILDQRLDAERHGYTVIRVWGSNYEMGYALGAAFAGEIETGWAQIKDELGAQYTLVRTAIQSTTWLPEGIEDEIAGILAGVKSIRPNADMDELDVKVMNTFSDWAYYSGCRSHSCWGSFVQDPVETLSTRRLDYDTPFDMALHHVLCAWDPDDGSVRWVNLAWPGYVTVITGVNAHGTVASLHDFGSGASFPNGAVCRSVATRHILTGMDPIPLDQHREWARQELADMDVACSSFINYYAPEGLGGVFTCAEGGSCGQLRLPQPDYFNGEVLITTNSQTAGHSVPGGGEFMHDYYQQGGPKDLQSHFDLMGTSGLHLMSVEVRGPGDMTIWFHGRGLADRIEVAWSELFPGVSPDGGPQDAGTQDGGQPSDGDTSDENGGSCGCGDSGSAGSSIFFSLVLALILAWIVIRHR